MLLKLSFASMRKLFKNYLVLLFGLTISIAIFYMFETLAQNKVFIESNSIVGSIVFIFHVGTFILGAITLFYIFYATSFMLSMRQKELGMYMTLGAKKHKVAQLMFFETLFIGVISLIVGLVLGVGLAQGIATLLMEQLDFSADGFQAFYQSSIITTVIFYLALFLLTSIVNAVKIVNKSVLTLIHAGQKQDKMKAKGSWTFIGVVFSIVLMVVGYYAMINIVQLQQFGIIIAAITSTAGTYLLFISLLPYLMKKVKRIRSLNEKGINSFTLGQLRFRINNLTRVLGTVAMLVALGLGAMTAGLSFYNNVELQAGMFHANDVVIHQPTEKDQQLVSEMDVVEKHAYHYKLTDNSIYFLKEDLLKKPPLIKKFNSETLELPEAKHVTVPLPEDKYRTEEIPEEWMYALSTELRASYEMFGEREIVILNQESYKDIKTAEKEVLLVRVEDFTDALPQIKKLEKRQLELTNTSENVTMQAYNGKYGNYLAYKSLASGTIFMGLFLGIAFLMMMASVLMFKLLSGASADIHRYNMLRKIGVRRSLLAKSVYRELFLVFLFPAIIGLMHVLIGMQMFSFILVEPYTKIYIPISIFLVIYGIYYWLTAQMYKRIVLPKE